MAAQFADEATVVDDEKEHANDLVLSYLKKAEELYDGLTDEEKQDSFVCYFMALVWFDIGIIHSNFKPGLTLDYFDKMLDIIEGGRECFSKDLLNDPEDFEGYIASQAVTVNYVYWSVSEDKVMNSEDVDNNYEKTL